MLVASGERDWGAGNAWGSQGGDVNFTGSSVCREKMEPQLLQKPPEGEKD